MTDTPDTSAEVRLRVAAGGILEVDGADRNGLLLEGEADMIRLGSRYWGKDVVIMTVAERDALRAEVARLREYFGAREAFDAEKTTGNGRRVMNARAALTAPQPAPSPPAPRADHRTP